MVVRTTQGNGSAFWIPAPSPRPVVVPTAATARYHFDGVGSAAWSDSSGNGHTLTPVAGGDAGTVRVPRGAGRAVRFPPRCDEHESCPRLALRASNADALNPGIRPVRFGASIQLEAENTSRGQNVLQKGYSTEGSQYKLQIDGDDGKPSCVLVGDTDPTIHQAIADVTVADGLWHVLECRRHGTTLSLLVDDVTRARVPIPADLSIANDQPLSLGAKGAYGDNDQFHGLLDDVWIAIG
ncbi:LamG-like jellyroll fold domain-containing protein [Paractinoplanes hotanensis]|uniref:LamG domain-containing protein n=1 Tax=Paractinoplanes hotanensis TaxID=2906497 RepID=A0ABT0Y524_9ACTN|nr:LamG-like jellyroll fold domain-containing protein [Actinoplanes hotanensis]MCM4081143.1 LamG domain-containing protein [Actinoplanes hotanensis]